MGRSRLRRVARIGVASLAMWGALALATTAGHAAGTTIHHTTAVVILDAPGQQNPTATKTAVMQQVFGVNAPDQYSVKKYWLTQTNGRLVLAGMRNTQGDVFGPYTVQHACDINLGPQEAQTQAQKKGIDLYAYQSTIWMMPDSCGGGPGSATQPGSQVFVSGLDRYVIDHELGHNFGNPHASSLRCYTDSSKTNGAAALSDFCDAPDEYGDPFDPMGMGGSFHGSSTEPTPYEMEPWRKVVIGAMPGSSAPTLNVSGTHQYTLAPLESSSGRRMIRLPDGRGSSLGSTRMFDLSFRQPTGVFDQWYNHPLSSSSDGDPEALTGVLVTWDPRSTSGKAALQNSMLLDMTPDTAGPASDPCTPNSPPSCHPCAHEPPGCQEGDVFNSSNFWRAENPYTHNDMTGFEDAPLPSGQSWSDPQTGLTLTVDSVGSTGAQVTITYGVGVVDVASPTAPTGLHAALHGRTVSLSWSSSVDNIGVTRYVVTRDGRKIQNHVTTTHTSDAPGPGRHVYTVRAADAAGNLGPASRVTIRVPSS